MTDLTQAPQRAIAPARQPPRQWIWAILAVLGAAATWMAWGFGFGSAMRIGAGALPFALSLAITLVALAAFAFPRAHHAAPIELRPLVAVVLAVILFTLLVERVGLVPAIFATMLTAYLGQVQRDIWAFGIFAALFALGASLLFIKGLKMPVAWLGWDF